MLCTGRYEIPQFHHDLETCVGFWFIFKCWQLTAFVFHAAYLQRVVISRKGHHQLPKWRKHHQGRELQLVVGCHVLEQHGQAMNSQVFPLVLLRALHRHRPCHGERHVHHHHRRHDELLLSATVAENSDPLHGGGRKRPHMTIEAAVMRQRVSPSQLTPLCSRGSDNYPFAPQNVGFSTDEVNRSAPEPHTAHPTAVKA